MTDLPDRRSNAGRTMVFSESIAIDDEGTGRLGVLSPARAAESSAFIDKLRAGDEEAFGTLVDRYSSDIYALLYRLTDNPEEAADLTQDTLLKALRSIGKFRGDSGLKTWLFRIAINESRNRFRWWKRRRRDVTLSLDSTAGDSETPLSAFMSGEGPTPEEITLRREREYAITVALGELKPAFREAVVLCDIEGLSYEEVADVTGVGVGTVKSRISRGREELREKLSGF